MQTFTRINTKIAEYAIKYLNEKQLKIYIALLMFANNETRQAYPTLDTLSAITGYSNRTIMRVTTKLAKLGLIKKEYRRKQSTIYTIIDGL